MLVKFTRRDASILILISLGVGLLTDILARQAILGINFFIWSCIWLVLLTIAAVDKKRFKPSFGLLGVLAFTNALMVYVRAEPVVDSWSVIIDIVSLLLMAGILYAPNFIELPFMNRFTELLQGGLKTIRTNGKAVLTVLSQPKHVRKPFRMNSGIIIAVVLGMLFIALFSGADAVFGHQFSFIGRFFHAIADWLGHYNLGRFFSIAFWVILSGAALLLIVGRATKVVPAPRYIKQFLSAKDSQIIQGTLCVIFVMFAAFQLRYLFIGAALPDHLTYAEYARRGYGQLLCATALAAITIYGTLAWSKNTAPSRRRLALPTVLVGLNGFIVLSAWKRLSLYEGAYGWTMTRFVARLGLICIFLGSVLLVLWVLRRLSTRQLFGGSWYLVAGVLTMAAILNPAGIIAAKNITERPQRNEPLDATYLNLASADSYPALCKYAPHLKAAYPAEYQKLEQPGVAKAELLNHSNSPISAHYTTSQHFRALVDGCL